MVVEIGIPAQHRSRRGSTFSHLPKNIANRIAVVLVVFLFLCRLYAALIAVLEAEGSCIGYTLHGQTILAK